MKHLKRSLTLPLAEVRSAILIAFLAIAIIGFADATYLTIEHFRGVIPPCTIVQGCELVLTSQYSSIFGIPTSLLGAIYYLIIAIGVFIYLESKHGSGKIASHHSAIMKWTLVATALGFGMSLWFIYLQLFILHYICLYCMVSALTSTTLFVLSIFILRKSSIIQTVNIPNLTP